MGTVSVTMTAQALLAAASASPAAEAIVRPLLKQIQIISVAGVKEHFQTQVGPDGKPWPALSRPRPDGSSRPENDTGRLKQSTAAKVTESGIELTQNAPGAAVQNYGATIRPRVAHFLALPVTVEAKRIGSPRQNGFPRPLFFHKNENAKHPVLAERQDGRTIVHYVLLKQVTIPARLSLGWSEKTSEKIERMVADRAAQIVLAMLAGTGVRL